MTAAPERAEVPLGRPIIVVPCYNEAARLDAGEFLRLAEHVDVWLVDDGSTDGSTGIALDYVSKYPGKIFYLQHANHANRGAAASRNLGVTKASGEFIAFLDSDDLYLPDRLRLQIQFLLEHPEVSVVCEGSKYWYSWADEQKKTK